MNVLHVLNVLTLGGGQALSLRVIEALQQRGIENDLCVVMTAARTHPIWRLPVEPRYLAFHGDYRRPVAWWRCIRQLQRMIGEVRPDVVHSLNWTADVTAARACERSGVPHVAYLVDRRNWMASRSWRHALRRRLTRRAFAGAGTHCMAVSAAVAEFVSRTLPLDRNRIDVVRNSIKTARFSGIVDERRARHAGGPVTVGMLSQLKMEKGHAPFLDSVELLVQRNMRLRVLIAGEGPLRDEIDRRAAGPALRGAVSVIGLVDDARDFYRECDIFVVPSIDSEGLPTTILEAMASGCAVVATDVGGAGEVIEHGVDGQIVPAGDPPAFADALQQIIDDAPRRTAMQQRARERALAEFDVEQMAGRIEAVFGRVVRGETLNGGVPRLASAR